jgi:hypothetical protein
MREYGRIANTPAAVKALVAKLARSGSKAKGTIQVRLILNSVFGLAPRRRGDLANALPRPPWLWALNTPGSLAGASSGHNVGVAGLNVGRTKIPTNFVDILGSNVTVTSGQTGSGTSGTVTLSNGDTFNLTGITNAASGSSHVLTALDSAGTGTNVFLSTVCFAAEAHILTATGERAIESPLQRRIVLTLSDGELKAQPVRWVGRRCIDLTAHPRRETRGIHPHPARCLRRRRAAPRSDGLARQCHPRGRQADLRPIGALSNRSSATAIAPFSSCRLALARCGWFRVCAVANRDPALAGGSPPLGVWVKRIVLRGLASDCEKAAS